MIATIRAIPWLPVRRFALRVANAVLKRRPIDFTVSTPLGFRFAGNTRDVIQRHVYVFGVWEPDITAWVRSHVEPGSVVVDVGANVGYFTLLAAELVGPTGHVHAIEPLPSALEQLRRNLALNENESDVVTVHPVACSDTNGQIEIFGATQGNLGNASTLGGDHSEGFVACRTVDALLADVDPATIACVKIDTEGDEAGVLLGAQQTLAGMSAGTGVLVEVTPTMLAARGLAAADVLQMMAGFDAYGIENDYTPSRYADHRVRAPQPLGTPPSTSQDVLFVKR